jgi:hypothetical protein
MPRHCSICYHPEREALDAALEAGLSYRDTAEHFNVSRSAIERHHKHSVPPTTVPGQNEAPEAGRENAPAEGAGREAPSPVRPVFPGVRKVYKCERYPELSLGGRLQFEHGRFETADPTQQQLIERSATFAEGFIRIFEVL